MGAYDSGTSVGVMGTVAGVASAGGIAVDGASIGGTTVGGTVLGGVIVGGTVVGGEIVGGAGVGGATVGRAAVGGIVGRETGVDGTAVGVLASAVAERVRAWTVVAVLSGSLASAGNAAVGVAITVATAGGGVATTSV